VDGEAAAVGRVGLELAVEHGGPLAHPDQPVAGAPAAARAAAVVRDLQGDQVVLVADGDLRAGGPGVLERIGQRLLDDPERGQVERRRQRSRRALDPERDRESRLANPADELLEVGQSRLRPERGRAVVRAEHAEQRPHLVDRLPAGNCDHVERVPHVRLVAVQHPGRGPGLDHHHGHVVGHHVVQLSRDPAPLDRHGCLRLQFPLLGELAVGHFQRRVLVSAAADGPPARPRRYYPDPGRDDVARVLAVQPRRDEDRC
jgi:hypothetical protein